MIRVVLADDHPVVLEGLRALFATTGRVEVIGEARDGEAAVRLANTLRPDVVVVDLNMPGVNGIEATRQICAAHQDIGVLVLTMFDDDESVFAAMRAGARGYVLKGGEQGDIVRAIETVAAGSAVFGPAIASRIASFLAGGAAAQPPLPQLTAREREVLDLIAQGRTNAEIARALVVSPKTVRNHISNVFAKLQVARRGEAIERAREAGLGGR